MKTGGKLSDGRGGGTVHNGRPGGSPGRPGLAPGVGKSPGRSGLNPSGLGRSPARGRVRPRGGLVPRGSQFVPRGRGLVPAVASEGGGAVLPRVVGPTKMNGAAVDHHQKHFVDSMLLEADRAANRFRSLVNEIRRSWYSSQRDDKTATLATLKIREAFVAARSSLETSDMKVIDIYRSNVEEADMRDIEPSAEESRGEMKRLVQEEAIFAKSELVDQNGIETLETTPDLPFREVARSVFS